MQKQIYISGPSASAPGMVQARQFYEKLAKIARGHGWRPYIPRPVTPEEHHVGITEFDLLQQDFLILKASHLMIADLTNPSSSVRAELSLALDSGVRIIGLVGSDRSTSRFMIEMMEEKGALILHYKDQLHACELVGQTLRSLTQGLMMKKMANENQKYINM